MDLRYLVEFNVLPFNLFNDKKFFLLELLPAGVNGIYSIYNFAAKRAGVINPYKIDDFDVNLIEKREGEFLFKIIMPTKEIKETYCKYVFVCCDFSKETLNVRYIAVEYTFDDIFTQKVTGNSLILGEVLENRNHVNYGSIENDDEKILEKIYNLCYEK